MGIVYAIYAIKDKYFPRFLLSVGILVVGACCHWPATHAICWSTKSTWNTPCVAAAR